MGGVFSECFGNIVSKQADFTCRSRSYWFLRKAICESRRWKKAAIAFCSSISEGCNIGICPNTSSEIENLSNKHNFPEGTKGEKDKNLDHGTMVPLHFIREVYNKGKIIILGISGLSYQEHYILGQIIKEAIDNLNRRVVYIASGDLSHCLK